MNDVNKVMTYVVFKQKHTKMLSMQPSVSMEFKRNWPRGLGITCS